MTLRLLFVFLVCLLSSCIGTRYLKSDEAVLYKQKIKTEGYKPDKDALNLQLAQTENAHPLGVVSYLVHVYQFGESVFDTAKVEKKRALTQEKFKRKISRARAGRRKVALNAKRIQKLDKLDKKLKEGNQFMRWGEQLAVFDSGKVDESSANLKKYLFSKGFFQSKVSANVKYKNAQKVVTIYNVSTGMPYRVDSIIVNIQDQTLPAHLQADITEGVLINGRYNSDKFEAERGRVLDLMSNAGYFGFRRQFVLFEVDSTALDDRRLIVRETVVNPPDEGYHRRYRLDSINFATESGTTSRTNRKLVRSGDITFDFTNDRYPVNILDWRIFLDKDSLYSKALTLETQRQLSYLDIFKFVNINYDTTGGQFVASIFTSPLKKFQTSTEAGLSVFGVNGLPGPFVNFNAKGRNIFRGLEISQLDASASLQDIPGVTNDDARYSRLMYGSQFSVTFPQFLFPMKDDYRSQIGRYNPRTKLALGVNFEDRKDEYERNTFNSSLAYIWQVKNNSQFTFTPFDISYIYTRPTATFQQVLEELEANGNRSLASTFRSSFVTFGSFSYTLNLNQYGVGNTNSWLIRSFVELGGNLQHWIAKEPFDPSLELEYFRFARLGADVRRNLRLNGKSALAYRVNVGLALAYGEENRALPYERYFFAGGSTGIRAWPPRRLGPGSYAVYDTITSTGVPIVNYRLEQPGEILLETSLEYRRKLVGFIDGAVFVDAGNIWLWKGTTVDPLLDGNQNLEMPDDGRFRFSSFWKEIAVGGGVGLRFDFSFLVLRIDAAYKLVDPAYPQGERFLLPDYRVRDLWNQNKVNINLGIGYPF